MVCLGVWHQPENQPCRVTDPGDVPPALIWRDWVRKDVVAGTGVFVRKKTMKRPVAKPSITVQVCLAQFTAGRIWLDIDG